MTTQEKLAALRSHMSARGVDILLITSDDYHQSEYVGDFFKSRAWASGFTGSAGTLIITQTDAKLFTDGRYYIQAERQLEGSTIDLMRSGTEGVPTPTEYMLSLLNDESRGYKVIATDGKCVSAKIAEMLRRRLPSGASMVSDTDFVGLIWEDRPALPSSEIWKLDEKYSGRSHKEKLSDVRSALNNQTCNALVMSSLCDIAWLYNLRGNDVEHTPVFLSYCIVTEDEDMLFANTGAISDVKAELESDGVKIYPYEEFYSALSTLKNKTVLVDKSAVSEAIVSALSGSKLVDAKNPTLILKAKKNAVELENIRRAHIADGLAVTKMMIELKYGNTEFNELTVEKRLLALRRECADKLGVTLIDESFGAICAFGANAAMAHYSATPESYSTVDRSAPLPMLLIDSGGQYLEGTTDITRTFVLGNIPNEVKKHYTLTACGMLRLANLTFLEGATGTAMDIICRQMMWEHGIDFRHGTGHGVGYLLSVHEGPNCFHWLRGDAKIEEGMITTDEPGIYVEGSHGIRIENELAATKAFRNEFGQFMRFENLTFCPIDLDGIDISLLDRSDIKHLNSYHQSVYDTLAPYLCKNDLEKLAYLTREIS